MTYKIYLLLLVCLIHAAVSDAQQSATRLKSDADLFFDAGKYDKALELLLQYQALKPGKKDVQRDIGICYYQLNKLDQSLNFLNPLSNTTSKPDPIATLYIGRIYHSQQQFKEAIRYYKLFLQQTESGNIYRKSVIAEIKRCASGLSVILSANTEQALVENLGEKVNTAGDEFCPILSPNHEDRLYFSAIRDNNVGGLRDNNGLRDEKLGHYCSDMFVTRIENGEWSDPAPVNYLLNSPRHDILLGFNSTGSILYFFKGFSTFSGQMLVDTFRRAEERTLFSPEMLSPMHPELGDCAPYFINDSILLFASRRAGGHGGLDLYVSAFSKGAWTEPVNLGPTINTSFDESYPYLAKDGRTLYFSSNNTSSIGGYDIFKSTFSDLQRNWSPPVNLGLLINSAGEDIGFRMAGDGLTAYFSSNRKSGMGGQDIYLALFRKIHKEQITPSIPASFFEVLYPDTFVWVEPDTSGSKVTTVSTPIENKQVEKPEVKAEELVNLEISPLYYNTDEDVLSPSNARQLGPIIAQLKANPDVRVILTGHSNETGPNYLDLYFTIKRVEKVAKYLQENGVKPENINLKSCGNIYPVAKNSVGDNPYLPGQKLNRRIEIALSNLNNLPLKVTYSEPVVSDFVADNRGAVYHQMIDGLSYKVQIAAIKRIFESSPIQNYPDAMIESSPVNGLYLYTLGLFQDFAAAELMRKNLVQEGIKDALIVVYVKGIRITPEEIKKYSVAYPDLLNYMAAGRKK